LAEARAHGDKTFITFEQERYSFDEFFTGVDRLGKHLIDHYKVKKGDRIAIAMRNYPEWMMALVAIVSVGAIVAPLNSWGQTDELAYTLADAGASLVFCDQLRADYIADRLEGLDCRAIVARGHSEQNHERIDSWESTQGG